MNNAENEKITSEWLKANTKISGWLVFFLVVVMGIGGLKRGLSLIAVNMSDCDNIFCFAAIDIFMGVVFILMSLYVIYSFLNRFPEKNKSFFTIMKKYLCNLFVSQQIPGGCVLGEGKYYTDNRIGSMEPRHGADCRWLAD